MIEPHHGFFSRLVHKNIHTDEQFDTDMVGWINPHSSGPLSGANQALSYIVFTRDIERFNDLYGGDLEILEVSQLSNGLRYLISGGVNFRQLLPSFMEPVLKGVEWLLSPLKPLIALHQIVVIRKKVTSIDSNG